MTKKEILTGNILIGGFMGLTKLGNGQGFVTKKGATGYGELEYHSSWNWLMPVVEKIGTIETPDDKYESGERVYVENFHPRTFGMKDEGNNFLFRFNGHQLQRHESLIGAVYLGVVDFVKWYNEIEKL